MHNFTFENQGSNTYLTYKLEPEEQLDSMSLGMLTNNKIPGIANTFFLQRDDDRFVKFNVSAKVPAEEIFSRPVSKKRILGVFQGVCDAVLSAEEYILDRNSLLVDLKYIFVDVSTNDTVLICLPLAKTEEAEKVDVHGFFRNLMFQTEFDIHENNDYVAKLLNYINNKEAFTIEGFSGLLEQLEEDKSAKKAEPKPAPPAPEQTHFSTSPSRLHPEQVAGQVRPQAQPEPKQTPVQEYQAGFAVPNQAPVQASPTPQKPGNDLADKEIKPEDEITFLYLMQHYNKENAAKYKEQRAIKKAKKEREKGVDTNTKSKGKKDKKPAPPVDYSVPGAPTSNQASNLGTPPVATPQYAPPAQVNQQAPAQMNPAPAPNVGFGETTVLSAAGETTVLGFDASSASNEAYLVRLKNNEKVVIDKPVFRIGKEQSFVDYYIADNSSISRSHANIVNKDGKYYLVDKNSTNHSYVANEKITSNEEVLLEDGHEIRLADEKFTFHC